LIAIPLTAVVQVLLDSMVINAEPRRPPSLGGAPWVALRTRVRSLREQARVRLRGRESRMGIDPATIDHLGDAVDQHIEEAVACVETIIAVAQQTPEPLPAGERAELIDKLHGAAEDIEGAVARGGPIVAAADDPLDTGVTDAAAAYVHDRDAQQDPNMDDLDRATQRIKEALANVEEAIAPVPAIPVPSTARDAGRHDGR
jgi:hypothetical protein